MEEVRSHRFRHREARKRRGTPVLSLIGYTNAGKSTLMNALTGAGVLAEDKPFATLDPVTRRVSLPDRGEAMLTDTVGFVQKLPHALVAAFRATLEELHEADLLLHVADAAHPTAAMQYETVLGLLEDLSVVEKPRLVILNKMDLVAGEDAQPTKDLLAAVRRMSPPKDVVAASAVSGQGLQQLRDSIAKILASQGRA